MLCFIFIIILSIFILAYRQGKVRNVLRAYQRDMGDYLSRDTASIVRRLTYARDDDSVFADRYIFVRCAKCTQVLE